MGSLFLSCGNLAVVAKCSLNEKKLHQNLANSLSSVQSRISILSNSYSQLIMVVTELRSAVCYRLVICTIMMRYNLLLLKGYVCKQGSVTE